MVKAKFIGSDTVDNYKTAQFDAIPGNQVSMSEDIFESIVSKGDEGLFTDIVMVEKSFPAQKTIGA